MVLLSASEIANSQCSISPSSAISQQQQLLHSSSAKQVRRNNNIPKSSSTRNWQHSKPCPSTTTSPVPVEPIRPKPVRISAGAPVASKTSSAKLCFNKPTSCWSKNVDKVKTSLSSFFFPGSSPSPSTSPSSHFPVHSPATTPPSTSFLSSSPSTARSLACMEIKSILCNIDSSSSNSYSSTNSNDYLSNMNNSNSNNRFLHEDTTSCSWEEDFGEAAATDSSAYPVHWTNSVSNCMSSTAGSPFVRETDGSRSVFGSDLEELRNSLGREHSRTAEEAPMYYCTAPLPLPPVNCHQSNSNHQQQHSFVHSYDDECEFVHSMTPPTRSENAIYLDDRFFV